MKQQFPTEYTNKISIFPVPKFSESSQQFPEETDVKRNSPVKKHFPNLSFSRPVLSTQAAQHAWSRKQPLEALWQARRGSWPLQSTLTSSEQDWTEMGASPLSRGCAVTVHPCYIQLSIFIVKSNRILFVFWETVAAKKKTETWITKHPLKIQGTLHSRDTAFKGQFSTA